MIHDIKKIESGDLNYLEDAPARDPETGMAIDHGIYDEAREEERRHAAVEQANYAEDGRHFDSTGKYLCGGEGGKGEGGCNHFRPGSKACISVKGAISGDRGSCRWWVIYDPSHVDLLLGDEKASKGKAAYGERKEAGIGFGCERCEYGSNAIQSDNKGRTIWCGIWAARVLPNACCGRNHKLGDKNWKDNQPLSQLEFYSRS